MITRINRLSTLRSIVQNGRGAVCFISTSPKKSDTATIASTDKTITETPASELFSTKNKNWVSWGFNTRDKEDDRNTTHATFFFSTTMCIVFASFIWYYQPDFTRQDWAQREAYLVLRRREAAGEDPVCKDYIDPAIMAQQLPSEEELGETEIII